MGRLIGINGKMGSGKDTVATIIQGITLGKTNEEINRAIGNPHFYSFNSKWDNKKFAKKLKQVASILSGVDEWKWEDQDFKKEYSETFGMTWREFLQKLGTEAMRNGLHTDVWVKALFADYVKRYVGPPSEYTPGENIEYPWWIITDMRFPNEMRAVKEHGGITIRVNVEDYETQTGKKVGRGLDHPSELALDDAEFDYEINNYGTIPELIEKVRDILIKENII